MSETQNKELAKSYDPASIEAKWYPFWEKQGYFKAGLARRQALFLYPAASAEHYRYPSYGSRLQPQCDGLLDPLLPHERLQHDVAAGNRPRRYRNSDRC